MAVKRLPLLESVSTVVVLGLATVLTAVPFGPARAGRNTALADGLALIRTAVFRYEMDHAGNGLASVADGAALAKRLLGQDEPGMRAPAYLTHLPENPVNGRSTLRVAAAGQDPPLLNGSAGWVFVPATGRVLADLPGQDAAGNAYRDY